MHFADITAILAFLAATIGLATAVLNFLNQQKTNGFSLKTLLDKYLEIWTKYRNLFYLYSTISSVWLIYDFIKSDANITRRDIFFLMLAGLNILFILGAVFLDRIFSLISRHLGVTESMQGQFSNVLNVIDDVKTLATRLQQHTDKHLKTTKLLIEHLPAKKKRAIKKRRS